jgi:hypothetical protein
VQARPIVKDPIAVFSASWLAERFGMDVVVMIRQPAAFVASFKRLGWRHDFARLLADKRLMEDHMQEYEADIRRHAHHRAGIVDEAILLWRMIYGTVDRYRAEHQDWRFVRHEDLSENPVTQFKGIYAFLGLPFTSSARTAIESHSSAANPERLMREHDTRLDSRASLQGWRSVLTPDEINRVRFGVRDVAPKFYAEGEW